jgi:hypothetical protein
MSSISAALHAHLTLSGRRRTQLSPGSAQLTYFIFEGVLTGFIGGEFIDITAFSGGAGGSKARHGKRAAPKTADANNPYSTGVKLDEIRGVRGGPLPTGSYTILPPSHHGHLGLAARLNYAHAFQYRDGGFYIHGQGPKGSDGCIVVPDEHFQDFMQRLKESHGGHLTVEQAMDAAFA